MTAGLFAPSDQAETSLSTIFKKKSGKGSLGLKDLNATCLKTCRESSLFLMKLLAFAGGMVAHLVSRTGHILCLLLRGVLWSRL